VGHPLRTTGGRTGVADDGCAHIEDEILGREDIPATIHELRAFQQGWAAQIMPVEGRWRLVYYSSPSFDTEPGTDFDTLEEALSVIAEYLPKANSAEERAKASDLERLLWLMLEEQAQKNTL